MKIKVSQLRRIIKEHIILEATQRRVPPVDRSDVVSLFNEFGIDEEISWSEDQVNFDEMIDNVTDGIKMMAQNYAESPTLMSDAQVEAGLRAVLGDPSTYGTDTNKIPGFMRGPASRGIVSRIADKFKISLKGRGTSGASADDKIIMSVMNSLMKLVKGDGQSPGLNKLADLFASYDLEPEAAAANSTLGPATMLMDLIAQSRDKGRFDKLGDKFAKSGAAGQGVAKAAKADAPTKIT